MSAASRSPEMPLPTPRMSRGRRLLILALVVVLVLALLGAVGAFFVAPRLCGLAEPARHGLACDIPLPAGAQFTGQPNPGPQLSGVTTETWAFTVSGAQAQVDTVTNLYKTRLPGAGWQCVQANVLPDSAENSQALVVAINGNRALSVTVTRGSPDNVLRLLILVGVSPTPLQAAVDIRQIRQAPTPAQRVAPRANVRPAHRRDGRPRRQWRILTQ